MENSIMFRNRHYQLLKASLIPFLILGAVGLLSAQRTVNGTVTDASTGETLIGANILVSLSVGTVTDLDGKFTLEIPSGYSSLSVSYTGYQSLDVEIGTSSMIDIALVAGQLLDEVIVIGYGTIKREDATGAVQSVSSESFNKGAITGAQELLAGKVAGVVVTTDGSPGSGSAIRIRGASSLSATNDPLIVIDGVPLDNGDISGGRNILNVINPNDIAEFTVLKDASASAIYGNRAAGGVIIITTKKGSVSQPFKVGYSGHISFGTPSDMVDMLSAADFRALIAQQYDETHPAHQLLGAASTNWQDEIYQTALGHDHNLYFSGSVKNIPYRASLGYTNKNGLLKTDNFKRLTTGINLNPGFLDNTLQVNVHFKGMLTDNHFAERAAIFNALSFDPTQSVRDPDSRYGGFTTWTIPNGNPVLVAPTNPVALIELKDDNSDVSRYILNVSADYRLPFLPDLRANVSLATDHSKGEGTVVIPTSASFAFDDLNGGGVNNRYSQTRNNNLLEIYLNYKKTIGKSAFDLLGGYSWQHFEVDNAFTNSDAAGTPSETESGSDPAEYFLLSMYGRLNYAFNDRYLLTLTLRRDGTSRFAPDNRWGLFPAAALAVKVLDNDKSFFNSLKMRVGWGITGQQDIGDFYAYLARYQIGTDNARYQFGNEFLNTVRANGYDAEIQWEKTETINIGVDFSMANARLSGSVDIYKRNTTDLLNTIPAPAGTNLTNFVTTNVGNMENKGFEVALFGTPVKTQKSAWEIAINLAYNQNEITKLTATDDPNYEGVLTGRIGIGSTIQIHSVGFAPRAFYVFEQLYDENGNILENEFADRNSDGIINGSDKYRLEKPAADYTFGISSKVAIGNFDLSFAGRASIGNFVYNSVRTDLGWLNRAYHSAGSLWNVNQSAIDLNVFDQASLTFSDHFVAKADFLKMDHITIGYNFNDLLGDFLRVYVTAQNPFVLTGYEGLDPEIFTGIDNGVYPRPRTFLFGVNIEF